MSIPALNTALYNLLGGTVTAAGSAIYFKDAPDGQALPYVIFDYTNDGDENQTPHRTKNDVVFIRAYASTAALAGTIDGQIDAKLHLKTLAVTGYTNFWTARENAFSGTLTDSAGKKYHMAGAEYRIRLQAT